ncbi:MAG: D-alanyl-D-alanine carboxypeptidase, partial [Gaiellales bacterium]
MTHRLTTRLTSTLILVIVLSCALLVAGTSTAAAASIEARVAKVVRTSGVSGISSVYVWDQETRRVVYTSNASRQVTPASTMKLLTSAAALARFGPEHRFETKLALNGTQHGSVFVGDVWIIGGGDPSLSTGGFARDNLGGRGANIARLTRPLRTRGISTIRGRIRVDDGMLDRVRWVPEWKSAFRFKESGALGALTVNKSATGRWTGVGVSRVPEIHAGETYRAMLRRDGIQVTGKIRRGTVPERAEPAGRILSPPLSTLVSHMNSASDNFYAEILLKNIGADRYGTEADGSTRQGRLAAKAELE